MQMKQLFFTTILLIFTIGAGFGQFDVEPKSDETTIEEAIYEAVEKIENAVESFDFEYFFDERLPKIVEDITPSEETIDKVEEGIREGLERIKEFDSSKLDDLMEELEESIEEFGEEIEDIICNKKIQKI